MIPYWSLFLGLYPKMIGMALFWNNIKELQVPHISEPQRFIICFFFFWCTLTCVLNVYLFNVITDCENKFPLGDKRMNLNLKLNVKGYEEIRLVVVLPGGTETLTNELCFYFLTTYDHLHPWLQVQNTAICLHPLRRQLLITDKNKGGKKNQVSLLLKMTRIFLFLTRSE